MENKVAELVFIPMPGVGHITSTVEIAKQLVNRDQRLSITVLIIKPTWGSGSAITTYIESLSNKSTIDDHISFIELIPQTQTQTHDHETLTTTTTGNNNSKGVMMSFMDFINSHSNHVRDLVSDMIREPDSSRVVGFVLDMFCMGMMDVANEFNIPTYVFFTSGAAYLGFKLYIQTLIIGDNNDDVIKMSNSDTELTVPCFVKPVPTNVFPIAFQNKDGLDFILWCSKKLREVKAIMINTFLELETHAIESLSSDIMIQRVYPVGPILNLDSHGSGGSGKKLDDDIIKWLDSQPPSSVVFLCFGSMGCFDKTQVKEIARGLELTGYRFVWSLRRPPSDQIDATPGDYDDPRLVLPEGFLERTSGIGKVIGWAPQVMLLSHRAVGGFVSHCGWNSLLESLWFGVPTATWPLYSEQQMNAFEMVVELGLSVEIKMDYKIDLVNLNADTVLVTGEEIESGIRRLMEDNEVRTKVKEMSEKSRAAVAEGGSSDESLGCLIQDFLKNVS